MNASAPKQDMAGDGHRLHAGERISQDNGAILYRRYASARRDLRGPTNSPPWADAIPGRLMETFAVMKQGGAPAQ